MPNGRKPINADLTALDELARPEVNLEEIYGPGANEAAREQILKRFEPTLGSRLQTLGLGFADAASRAYGGAGGWLNRAEARKQAEKQEALGDLAQKRRDAVQKYLLNKRLATEQARLEGEREFRRGLSEEERAHEEKLQRERLKSAEKTAVTKAEEKRLKKEAEPTVAQKEVDKQFAKEYANFIASGGVKDVEKNVKQLEEVANRLESGKENLTGGVLGRLPDWAQQATGHSAAVDLREAVEEVVQRNLRLVLGAQFTEKEGERLIARAYNPKLDEKTNAKRLKRLIGQIKGAAKAKVEAGRYYEENGTLQGWQGTLATSPADFLTDEVPPEEPGTVRMTKNGRFYDIPANEVAAAKLKGYKPAGNSEYEKEGQRMPL